MALIAVMGLAALGIAEISDLVLVAVAAILLLRCIDSDEAWGSINAGILVFIFSKLIVGARLQHTGAVALLVDAIVPLIQGLPPVMILAAIYLMTSVLTEAVTNNAVADRCGFGGFYLNVAYVSFRGPVRSEMRGCGL